MTDHREIIARALCLFLGIPEEQWERFTGEADKFSADIDKRGLCIVPKEPTEAMWAAGEKAWMNRNPSDPESDPIRDCYRAMISAAPK